MDPYFWITVGNCCCGCNKKMRKTVLRKKFRKMRTLKKNCLREIEKKIVVVVVGLVEKCIWWQ